MLKIHFYVTVEYLNERDSTKIHHSEKKWFFDLVKLQYSQTDTQMDGSAGGQGQQRAKSAFPEEGRDPSCPTPPIDSALWKGTQSSWSLVQESRSI